MRTMTNQAFLSSGVIISTILMVICQTRYVAGNDGSVTTGVDMTQQNYIGINATEDKRDNYMAQYMTSGNGHDHLRHGKTNNMVADVVSRSYNGYGSGGGGGGGGGSYNSGTMMYYSNFDTALTTLAFLSFGVFLLNMVFSFLDFGTPLGPVGGKEVDGIKVEKRSTGSGATPTMSPAALVALSAIQQTLIDNNKDNSNNQEVNESRPECAFRLFCDASQNPELRQRLDGMFSALTSFILTGKLRTNNKLWESAKLHQLLAMMENGGCDELIRMCPSGETSKM